MFDFLGLTHSWAKSRKGKNVVRQTTAKNRFARSLATVKDWCRTHRHLPPREQHAWLTAVLNGHFAYYGITGNIRQLQDFRYQVVRTWHKWLARRTRGCQRVPRPSPAASGQDRSPLRLMERISRAKNRMR